MARSRSADAHLDKIITRPPPTPIRCYLHRTRAVYCSTSLPTAGARKTFQPRHIAGSVQIARADVRNRPERATQFALQEKKPHLATCLEFGLRSCIQRDKLARAARTQASSCRSRATTPSIWRVPGQKYTFCVVKAAQLRGDFEVLVERKHSALRAHLGANVAAHLGTLDTAFVRRCARVRQADLASLRRT